MHVIRVTRTPVLTNFKPIRRIELLRTGLYSEFNQYFIHSPVWEGGDLYPIDDENWDKYVECIKNNNSFEWESDD